VSGSTVRDAHSAADLSGRRLDTDQDAGRPELGILRANGPRWQGSLVTS
jgi:hypothetical protein